MAAQQVTPPLENDFHTRKRVCKACDRCRLKKSKVGQLWWWADHKLIHAHSVMVSRRVAGVEQTMRYAYLEREKRRTTKSIPKGKANWRAFIMCHY